MSSSTAAALAVILFALAGVEGSLWLFAWLIKCWVVRWLARDGRLK